MSTPFSRWPYALPYHMVFCCIQVVDFRFNPSTGQVCSLIYDKTSLPLPRFAVLKLVDLWSTGAQHVRSVDSARLRITLKPGHRTVRKSAGWLEWVFSRLQVIPPPLFLRIFFYIAFTLIALDLERVMSILVRLLLCIYLDLPLTDP